MAKVFVADDNPHVQRMVEEVLGADGHEISGAADGADLLERISEANRGITAQRALADTQLVLLAGPLDTVDDNEATQAGVHSVLQKPLSAEALTALVEADEVPEPGILAEGKTRKVLLVEDLVKGALEQPKPEASREAIREQVEAVMTASMPAMIDRITDRLAERLKGQ